MVVNKLENHRLSISTIAAIVIDLVTFPYKSPKVTRITKPPQVESRCGQVTGVDKRWTNGLAPRHNIYLAASMASYYARSTLSKAPIARLT